MNMDRKRYFRLIYQRTFRHLGAALVIALLTGTLLGGGIYTVSALCAAGFGLIAWGWFTHLKRIGMQPFGRHSSQKKTKVPWLHRRFKEQRSHRPSFRMDSADFDDDLTSATMVSAEDFTESQQLAAAAFARMLAGALLVLFSFFIPV